MKIEEIEKELKVSHKNGIHFRLRTWQKGESLYLTKSGKVYHILPVNGELKVWEVQLSRMETVRTDWVTI